jgi:hypothetical protein
MKKKTKIFGLGLSLVMVLTLLSALVPAAVMASPADNEWEEFDVPKEAKSGDWALAPTDVGSESSLKMGPIAKAIDGTLYCYVGPTTILEDTDYTLFKSSDGGREWEYTGDVKDTIVDIACSPDEADVLYYATTTDVYKSDDAADEFSKMISPTLASDVITSLDCALLGDDYVTVIGTADGSGNGYVYLFDEGGRTSANWSDQSVGSYDVYGVAMSPNYSSDKQIVAVVTDGTQTKVTTRKGSGGWNSAIGDAVLEQGDVSGANVEVTAQAAIEFPSDYDSDPDEGNANLFVGITDNSSGSDTGGDVYGFIGIDGADKSVCLDKGVNLDITDIAVTGPFDDAIILAGTTDTDKDNVKRSDDGGGTWYNCKKEPSGDAGKVYLVMADDYEDTAMAWAANGGTNGGVSLQVKDRHWNTIGLINTRIGAINDLAPFGENAYMCTANTPSDGPYSVWKSGSSWDRVFTSTLTDAGGASIDLVQVVPDSDGDSAFLADKDSTNKLWRSTDGGARFIDQTRAPDTSDDIEGFVVVSDSTVFVGGNGKVYKTTNNGQSWSDATLSGAGDVEHLVLSPDYDNDSTVLAGCSSGEVWRSTNAAKTFSELKDPHSDMGTEIWVAFDPDYAENLTMYCVSAEGGVYRYVKDESSEWTRIDAKSGAPDDSGQLEYGASGIVVGSDGALYATDNSDHAGEGVSRCLDPTNSVLSAPYPFFERANDTEEGALAKGLCGLWLGSKDGNNKLWSIYDSKKIYTMVDSLVKPVILAAPADGTDAGRTDQVTLEWEALPGAIKYEVDVSSNAKFRHGMIADGETTKDTSYRVEIPASDTGVPIYWRVRVYEQQPYRSLRSDTWIVTTELVGGQWNPFRTSEGFAGGIAPAPGATVKCGVVAFQWNAADWATGYELMLALNDTFTSPVASVTVPNPAWVSDVELKCDTIYFWRVRAVSDSSKSEWGVGSFLTEPEPEAPAPPAAPPVVNVPEQPAPQVTVPSPIPIAAIWAIIIIGGVLLIAIIILIVVTRRAPR